MKKKIFAYALITCMLGAAACGKSEENKLQTTDAVEHDVSMQESKENNRDNDETNDVEEDTVETSNNTIIEETTTSKSEEESAATEVTENSEGTSLPESNSESEVKETEISETEDLELFDEEHETADEEL